MSNSNYPAYYTQSQGKRLEGYAFQNGKRIFDLLNLVNRENVGEKDEKNGIPITKFHKLSIKSIPLTQLPPSVRISTSEGGDLYDSIGYVYGQPSFVQYKHVFIPGASAPRQELSTNVDYSDTYIIRFPFAKLAKYDGLEKNIHSKNYIDVVPDLEGVTIQDAITGLIFDYNITDKCWECTVQPYGQQYNSSPFISDSDYKNSDIVERQFRETSLAISYSYFCDVLSSFNKQISDKINSISSGDGNQSSPDTGSLPEIKININGDSFTAQKTDGKLVYDLSDAFAAYLTQKDLPKIPDMSQYVKRSGLDAYVAKEELNELIDLSNYAKKSDIPATPDLSGYAKTSDLPDMSQYAKKDELPEGVDLSEYAKKTDIPTVPDMTEYAKKTDIPSAPDLSEYAKVTDIPAAPDLSDYAKKSEIPTAPDLTPYALKTELPPDFSKAITDHVAAAITSENGLHGIRYYEGKLQVLVNENWNDIVAPSSGSDVTRKEFDALKSLVDSLSTGSGQSPIVEGVLTAGQTKITITSDLITEDSALRFYTSIYGVNPKEVHAEKGKVTLTFETQDKDMTVGVQVVQKG